MPWNISDLRTALEQAGRDTHLRVDAQLLDLAPAGDLFATFLPDAVLDIRDVTSVDTDGLRVSGKVTLLNQAASAADVLFFADDNDETVAGVRVDVVLTPDGPGLPAELSAIPSALERIGLGPVHLVFGVEPGIGDDAPTAETGCGVELLFPDAQASPRPYVWGYPPRNTFQSWQLAGDFSGVPLPAMDSLLPWAGLLAGSFDLLPAEVAQGASLRLTDVSVNFDPQGPRWLGVGIGLELGTSWEPLPGLLKLDKLAVDFTVVNPHTARPAVAAVLSGIVTLADEVTVGVGVSFPDRSLTGTLLTPLPLGHLLTDRFPGVPVPAELTVSRLELGADLERDASWGYGVELEIQDVWKAGDDFALSDVTLVLRHQDNATAAEATAGWQLGDATVDVYGAWATGAGWKFSAEATHLQPADVFSAFGIAPPPVLKDVDIAHLAVDYDSASKHFGLQAQARFPLGTAEADLDLSVDLTKRDGATGYDQTYAATLSIAIPQKHGDPRVLTFAVKDAQLAEFTASCTDTQGVSLADVAGALGVSGDESVTALLGRLGTVTALTIAYSGPRKSVVFAVKEKDGGSLLFVSDQQAAAGERVWAVRAGLGLDARLSQIPLLHGQIPDGEDVGVRGLGVLIASHGLSAARVAGLNRAVAAADAALPALPGDGLAKGLAFVVDLRLPGRTTATSVVVRGGGGSRSKHLESAKQLAAAPAPSAPMVAWIGVQRAVGPLRLRRVGVGFAAGTVWMLFDASLGMAGLDIGVEGLGLGIPLDDPGNPSFRLDGMSVGYARPPLAIKGALVSRTDDPAYDTLVEGALVVSAEQFGLTALGAYAWPHGSSGGPSMFLFGKASGQFGGPPPVEVTEIMAGFGFNTDLRLPEGDQVLEFPFLQDMTDTEPLDVLQKLMGGGKDAWVRPAAGQLWFAAGLGFRVFEFLDGQALLVLEVGEDFAVAVLGTAEARFPKTGPQTYARVRMGLSAKYRASEQILKVTAQLAPGSYLLDEACVLTGGFALYTWFDEDHAGDFVLTLGGYHPHYPVPAHYPKVPRLGFSWPVTSELTISGGSYFALTPGAIMAGGALDVNYRSGDLHAWLTAHANMLIEWAPFHFEADVDVSVGVSFVLDLWLVRETIRVEIGASLRLWGPPTAGEVTIHLWFISFSIAFGEGGAHADDPAPWADVVKQLPARENAVRLAPMDGLLPVRSQDEPGLWIVAPGAFSFAVRTAVPVSTLRLDGSQREITGHKVNIRPRHDQGTGLASVLTVTLTKGTDTQDLGAWYAGRPAENRASLPGALWSAYDDRKLDIHSTQQVTNQLMGVDLRLPAPAEKGDAGLVVGAGVIAHDDRKPDGILPLRQPATAVPVALELGAEAPPELPADVPELVVETVRDTAPALAAVTSASTGTTVAQSRDRLFAAMEYLDVSPGSNEPLKADDALVAGDIDAKPDEPVPGTPTASERLYVLGAGRTVTPVDAQSLTAYPAVGLDLAAPTLLAVSPDGTRLCVVNDDQGIDVRDISANPPGEAPTVFSDTLWGYKKTRGASVSPDSKWAYVTAAQSRQMLILDLTSTPPGKRDFAAQGTSGEAVPAAKRQWDAGPQLVYLARTDQDTVARVDVTPGKWPAELTPALPAGPSPTRLAVDPLGRWVYALNAGRSTVTVTGTDPATGIVATLRTGTDPSALVASPDGTRLYVANATSGTVSVFDTSGAVPQETGEPVWIGPDVIALAVSAAGDRLFAVRSRTRVVHVVDTTATPPVLLPGTVPLTDDPVALAVTAPAPVTTGTKEGGAA
ncbi:YncE family protein [Streptomyces sp. AV19]|uniref:YncE family protein n=1 Tax=Streptomyces sp. AV19 TaxID=2793068 RepID=UPI0018FE7610|nr:YncE family protein [Streptomyces sp. AV19]MBH1937715.1 YncE family protein [Streptomyces sp. AV19]MDG4536383.1 YncE family protein [Streptomyces sp. AV19]